MKALMVCNPGSRAGRRRQLWPLWRERLTAAGLEVEQAVTATPEDARRLVVAAGPDVRLVVAVGGDGTISQVLDGILQSGREDLRLGVLYAGTSPDFCCFHGIPTAPEDAIRNLLHGRARHVDVGRIHFCEGGRQRQAHFGCSVNVGLGPEVARVANRLRPFLGDTLGTGAAAFCAICRQGPLTLQLHLDGESLTVDEVNNLSVVLNPLLASGLKLDLPLHGDDGYLMVVLIRRQSRRGLLRLLPAFYSGEIVRHPDVLVRCCRRLEVTVAGEHQVEFDGDPRGQLPAIMEVLPRRLQLICPSQNGDRSHV